MHIPVPKDLVEKAVKTFQTAMQLKQRQAVPQTGQTVRGVQKPSAL
jgi:hypothetical protein